MNITFNNNSQAQKAISKIEFNKSEVIPTDREDGIYFDMTDKEYFSNKERVSASQLKKIYLHSEMHLLAKPKKSKQLSLGTYVHEKILEPDKFQEKYAVLPENIRNDKRLKAYKEFVEDYPDKEIISHSDYNEVFEIEGNIKKHTKANELLFNPENKYEVAIYWTDQETGVKCKGKIDILNKEGILDLKTTADASPEKFAKAIHNYGYNISMPFYRMGLATLTDETPKDSLIPLIFVVTETVSPFCVEVYKMLEMDIEQSFRLINKLLNDYKKIKETGIYHNYTKKNEIVELELNSWDKKRINDWMGYSEYINHEEI